MTDDEILKAADRIKRRRAVEAQLSSLDEGRDLMIRWTRPGVNLGGSSVGVPVSANDVRHLVEAYFAPLIAR